MITVKDSLAIIKKYWDTAPVDVFAISRELGLPILRADLPANISGMIRRDGDGYMIVLNGNNSMTRQRFTVAHELGHYIYHRDLLGKGVGDTLAFRSEGSEFPNSNITPMHERQANNFAANLLMPLHLIELLKSRGLRTPAELAAALGVSEAAMRIKLGVREPAAQDEPDDSADWVEPHL